MSDFDIDASYVRPMEVHLGRISNVVITLDYNDNIRNKQLFNNVCKFLTDEMKENDDIFDKLFQSRQLAGSYPDNLKISEPDEYDVLIILNFPSPRVAPSRPGYVTINVGEAIKKGWNIGEDNYEKFVDDDRYLIQNKVLNWIRQVVRSTLQEHKNLIEVEGDTYEIFQSSNGPAVTLDVNVITEDVQFSIDFVGSMAFHSDEWWMADKLDNPDVSGVWNTIPKPIKANAYISQKSSLSVQKRNPNKACDNRKLETSTYGERKVTNEIKGNEAYTSIVSQTAAQYGKSDVVAKKGIFPFWRFRKSQVNTKSIGLESSNQNMCPKKPNATKKENIPSICSIGYRDAKKATVKEAAVMSARTANKSLAGTGSKTWEKPNINGKAKPPTWYGKSTEPKGNNDAEAPTTVNTKRKRKESKKIPPPNPNKNREWICSYAEIERQYLKGTDSMKPLIRIFKKIRDTRKLTNLKSYYIKTIFLHQHVRKGADYWKQSLAILFMEMLDVILTHLKEHRLDSLWHKNFNLFQLLRSEQITAVYENLLKMKKDLIKNLVDGNPEFIYEVVCTEDERSNLTNLEF